MSKTVIKKRKDMTFLRLKAKKGQQLNMREIESMKNHEVSGLFYPSNKMRGKKFVLEYNVTGCVSLFKFFKNPIIKEEFAILLSSIYETMNCMQTNFFNQQNLLLELKRIYVNPSTKRASLIYIPIQQYDNGISLKNFLLSLADNAIFSPGQDTAFLKEYVALLHRGINFSLFELEEYIKRLTGKAEKPKCENICTKCGNEIFEDTKYCPVCGNILNGEKPSKELVYVPPEGTNPSDESYSSDFKSLDTRVIGTDVLANCGDIEDPVSPEPEKTAVVDIKYPYLIRQKNNEKIIIDKPSFRLGKEARYCDYFIADNTYVSRSHADIIAKEGKFFIVDNNSLNKTFLNGKVIQPNSEVELFEEVKICLADEEFLFYVK